MIIGSCPYEGCDGAIWLPVADPPPRIQKHDCEKCGRVIWTRHSRIDPWSMTDENFRREYVVDEATHSVTARLQEGRP
jgi:hypothetical protein